MDAASAWTTPRLTVRTRPLLANTWATGAQPVESTTEGTVARIGMRIEAVMTIVVAGTMTATATIAMIGIAMTVPMTMAVTATLMNGTGTGAVEAPLQEEATGEFYNRSGQGHLFILLEQP